MYLYIIWYVEYDKEYNGYQVAKRAGAEDADSRWTDQAGQIAQEWEIMNGGIITWRDTQ